MTDSVLEHEEQIESWYTSEAPEKVLFLRARRYFAPSPVPPVHRRIQYGPSHLRSKAVIREVDRSRRRLSDRWQRPPEGTPRQEISRGIILAVQKMIELLELPPGWNSYNARPIKKENVNAAIGILGQTMGADTPVPNVIPLVRGGVQLEWHTRGINLEVSIYSPSEVSFFAEDTRGRENPVDSELDLASLRGWIERLSS